MPARPPFPGPALRILPLLLGAVLACLPLAAQSTSAEAEAWLQRARESENGDSTEFYLDLAQTAVQDHGMPRLEADILSELADVYSNTGRFEQNLRVSQRAIDLYRLVDAPREIAYVTNRLARSFKKMGDVNGDPSLRDRALDYARQAVHLATTARDTAEMMEGYNLVGVLHRDLRQWPPARQAYLEGLRLAEESGIRSQVVGSLYANLGQWYMDFEKDYQRLIDELEAARVIYDELGDSTGIEHAYRNLGHAYLHMGDLEEAIRYGKLSVAVAQGIRDPHRLFSAYEELAEAQEEAGQYMEALRSFQTARKYERATLSQEEGRTIAEMETRYRTREKEATIANREAELARVRRTRMLAFAGLGLLAVAVFFIWRIAHLRRRTNEELTRRNADIEAQRAEIEEKNRQNEALIHEIHHRVKNNLQVISSLLNLQSHHLEKGDALDALRAGQSRVKSIALLHQTLYRHGAPAAIGMDAYTDLLLNSIGSAFGVRGDRIRLVNEVVPRELDVDRAVSLGLIINELVTNALKYAFPGDRRGRVVVSLTETAPGRLRLGVTDDGVGTQATSDAPGATHFGTRLIGILAQKLGGKLSYAAVGGTGVYLDFRVDEPALVS
ncbi:sensor histidine kinase [Lewinella sp. IMCC34183]|uniref:sensor histidine kinase n=1 Tax=Lewinella sp. IMCC34183 TaxID=2248762 RepID=UPI000E2435DC|nr:histidine kinase dimerization/phosphoacceptor domain -containing protein [Lewinella sp. IMCC34183]